MCYQDENKTIIGLKFNSPVKITVGDTVDENKTIIGLKFLYFLIVLIVLNRWK